MLTLKHKLIFLSLISSIIVTGLPSMALAASCEDSTQTGLQKCLVGNPIVKDLNIIVDFLSIGVGIVVIGSIILGGIQYAMAGEQGKAENYKRIYSPPSIYVCICVLTMAYTRGNI
jgi:hypothetical protein